MHAKGSAIAFEQLILAILFIIVFLFIGNFLARLFINQSSIPEWSKSLSNLEKAIGSLDEQYISVTRSANVQLKESGAIHGYSKESGKCIEDQELPGCVCYCSSQNCDNALNDREKYCKPVKYPPANDGFTITNKEESPLPYKVELILEGSDPKVNVIPFRPS